MKVEYVDHMGSDLSVVNAARVSMDKKSDWACEEFYETVPVKGLITGRYYDDTRKARRKVLSKADQSLISYLARGCSSGDWDKLVQDIFMSGTNLEEIEDVLHYVKKMPSHWTPFAHTAITVRMKAPIFIRTQCFKHKQGFVENEVSRRYVTTNPEFFVPEAWRKKADNVKQGSSEEEITLDDLNEQGLYGLSDAIHNYRASSVSLYVNMLKAGVCPEQARMVLPQSMMTEWMWTGNLYSFANFYNSRSDAHAQKEIRDLAELVREVIEPLYPVSWKELTQ